MAGNTKAQSRGRGSVPSTTSVKKKGNGRGEGQSGGSTGGEGTGGRVLRNGKTLKSPPETPKQPSQGSKQKKASAKTKKSTSVPKVSSPLEMTTGSEQMTQIPWLLAMCTYLSYAFLIAMGHTRDFTGRMFRFLGLSKHFVPTRKGYAPLLRPMENFYTRRLYHRISDLWNRPISSSPGTRISVLLRQFTGRAVGAMRMTGEKQDCVNLGSYNYLGFADDWQETCSSTVLAALKTLPIGATSPRMDTGTMKVHRELEATVARFIGKEAALVFNMGFGTNATTIPALVGQGSLIVSDSLNHTSIVSGCRASGAKIRTFAHNDAGDLAAVLREAIALGQPRTRRPWKKVLVVVEGIYSMEGEICDLRAIVDVCKKYRAYIYLDEAHSIGALGKTGRGACEYCGVSPSEIDIMMGTFTKSFSGMGGYIAGSKELIGHLQRTCAGLLYHNALSPIVSTQILTALRIIMGEDGTDIGKQKLERLRDNSNYMRRELVRMGLHVYGTYDSPVIPVMLYTPAKIAAFSRFLLVRGLAVVVVGFPATSVILSRSRICMSAGHTKEDIDYALTQIKEASEALGLRYECRMLG